MVHTGSRLMEGSGCRVKDYGGICRDHRIQGFNNSGATSSFACCPSQTYMLSYAQRSEWERFRRFCSGLT